MPNEYGWLKNAVPVDDMDNDVQHSEPKIYKLGDICCIKLKLACMKKDGSYGYGGRYLSQ